MKKSVDDLISDVLRREGGYVNHPSDRGGPTKYGITQATLAAWLGRPATADDVRALDEDTAREIYAQRYYHGPRIDSLPEAVRPVLFDVAVNSGPRRAIMMAQQVINEAGFGPVDVDGALGPQTRKAVDRAAAEMGPYLVNALVEERKAFYAAIIARDPSQAVFERGWMARAEEFRQEVA
jgi:lysozyme family protein